MDPDRRRLLADLLLDWEDRFATGVDVSAAELASEHPGLVGELDRRIRALKATLWLDHAVNDPVVGLPAGSPKTVEPPLPLAGRYRLDEVIGVGGFAEVWRGFDIQLQRVVAIKIPRAPAIHGSDAFLEEARRVAALQHPGIITVYDVGNDRDRWFIVSEFVPGGSLAGRLARATVSRGDAVRWVGQIAAALDAAHRAGLVHRDVKPENILITAGGDALLTDFGIARRLEGPDEAAAGVGTLWSMAPEQLAGGPPTPATDTYALGMVLHETLAGGLPFRSTSPNGIRGEIAAGVADRVAGSIPPRLAAICRRALALDPSHRYPTAGAMAAALHREGLRHWQWLAATAAVVTGLAVVAAVSTRTSPAPAGIQKDGTLAIIVPDQPPLPLQANATGRISIRCPRIHDINSHVVEADNVRIYHEWQDSPLSYVGPALNDVEGRIVYRFDVARPITAARLLCTVFCGDGTVEANVDGRGAGAIDVSKDGVTWVEVCSSLDPPQWGEDWAIDKPLPDTVLGETSLWLRVRLLTTGSRKTRYTTAQFGRDLFADFPALQGVFGLDLEVTQ